MDFPPAWTESCAKPPQKSLFRGLGESLKEECTETVPNCVTERRDSQRIMAARERKVFERDAIAADRGNEFVGQFAGERGVVAPADRQNFFSRAVETSNIRIRTDR